VRFLDAVDSSPRVRVVQVAESLEATALTWLRSHDAREYSFVDATSFAVMHAMGIDRALAYDGDFTAAGFLELR
jgi:uncharacterized protein